MTTLLGLTITGVPVGQGRPRAVRMGNGAIRMHPAQKSAKWQALAAQAMRDEWGEREPYAEPVRLVVIAVGTFGSRTVAEGVGRQWRTTKPDVDNVVKAVADALVAARVIVDDTLVCELVARSQRCASDEGPHVEIALGTLDPLPVVEHPSVGERRRKAVEKEAAKAARAAARARKGG